LMEIQMGSGGLPFFAIASPGVESLGYSLLALHMGPEQAVYKLQGRVPVVGNRPFTEPELYSLSKEYIAAMRTAQPEGPYCFIAMCEGVQIAQEIVLDLEAQGQEVGLFAILDTWVLQNAQRPWLWLLDYYRQRLRALWKMSLAEQFQVCKQAANNQLQRLTGKSPARSEWQQAYWPGKQFRPPKFRAPVVLFKRPRQPFYYVNDPEMGWGARSTGGVEIQIIDFHHWAMLREPYVRTMGEVLAARMQRLRQGTADWPPHAKATDSTVAAATSERMA